MQPLKGPNNKQDEIPPDHYRDVNGEIKPIPDDILAKAARKNYTATPSDNLYYGIAVVAALVMAFSVFLPWATVQAGRLEISVNGMGQVGSLSSKQLGDGIFVIGGAIIIGLVAIVGYIKQQGIYGAGLLVLGLGAAGFQGWEINNLLKNTTGVSVGYGLIAGIAAAVVVAGAGALVRFKNN